MAFQDIIYAARRTDRRHHAEPAAVPQRPELPDARRDRRRLRSGARRRGRARGAGARLRRRLLHRPRPRHAGGDRVSRRRWAPSPASRPTTSSRSTTSTCCLKWRNFPKPTIAMVEGYCIYAGWMLAAAMDMVFAAETAEFLGGFVEYNTIPWDIGVRRAKELVFESRFISAAEAAQLRFRQPGAARPTELERETFAWARRVAENSPEALRMAKIQMNKAQDAAGLHQRRRGQPRRLPGDDAHARHRDAHGRRAPPAHRRPGGQGQARRAVRAGLAFLLPLRENDTRRSHDRHVPRHSPLQDRRRPGDAVRRADRGRPDARAT